MAQAERYSVPWLVPAGASGEPQGVLRILNGTDESGSVEIYAIDDAGTRSGPASFMLNGWAAVEFTAADLRSGNAMLGLTGGIGADVGDARLEIETDLDIVPLALVRAADGTLSAMHDTVRGEANDESGGYTYEVSIFNPSTEVTQVSRLRLINPGGAAAEITISGRDDSGAQATGGEVTLTLPAGGARTLTNRQLEVGGADLAGSLGAATGRWRLTVSSDRSLQVVNIVASSAGYWNNLSTTAVPGAAPQDGTERDGDDGTGEVVEITYAMNDSLPGVPSSGAFAPTIHGDGSIRIAGNDTTISLNDGAYFELKDGTRYTCTATEGCTIANGIVSAGTVAGRTAGAGEVDRFPSFRAATAPGRQSYTVDEAIDTLILPEASGGNGDLTYGLSPEVPGLTFDSATRQLSGTPSRVGNHAVTYTVTDEDGDTDTLNFTIAVSADTPTEGSLGDCHVGLTVGIGQSCTYPGTTDEFSVNARGRGSFLGRLAGIRIRIDNETINGRVYDFEASHQGDGVWRIDRVADRTEPPDDEEPGGDSQEDLLALGGCTDGRFVNDPGDNPGLVGDCRALVGFVNALARSGELPAAHTLRQWGTGTQTMLASWEGIAIDQGRVTSIDLPGTRDEPGPVEDIGLLAALTGLTHLNLQLNSVSDLSPLTGLTNLTSLNVFGNEVWDLSPLSRLTNLTSLELGGNNISNISPLSELVGLTRLDLGYNRIPDISPLSKLTALTWLRITNNNISDIVLLAGLSSLMDLNLQGNAINDVSPLAGLTNLTSLWLGYNNIRDVSSLTGLTNLTRLDLADNVIEDTSPLAGLTNLTLLWLGRNNIGDVSSLTGLTNLTRLGLADNAIEDIAPLSGLTNLRRLDLADNAIGDIAPLSVLTNVSHLSLGRNNIADISALTGLINLTRLDLSGNAIEDISPLSGLTNVSDLSLNWNNIADISSLTGLINLTRLDLSGNAIKDISPLLANTGLGEGDTVDANNNPLSDESINIHIAVLQARGAEVSHPQSLADEFPDSRLHHLYNDNVIVMQVDGDVSAREQLGSMAAYAAEFYRWFEDEFDYLVFHSNLTSEELRISPVGYIGVYLSAMNNTEGVGLGRFLRSEYGSAGRLRGVIHIPAHFHGPLLHELMHTWANFAVPTSHGVHWGFSSAAGQLGGFDIATLTDLGNGRWTAGRQRGRNPFGLLGRRSPFSPIELYFAGLAPPDEVPDLWVAKDGAWEEDENGNPVFSDNGFRVFTARNVRTWSIEDIVALNGARNPPEADDSREQRAAMILLTDARHPPNAAVLQEMSERATRFGLQGDDGDPDYYNYYEATLGRATLTLDGLSALRKNEAFAPANLPASFGTPPPPHMTTIEELCGSFVAAALADESDGTREVHFTGRGSDCSWTEGRHGPTR